MVLLPAGYCIDATEVTRLDYQVWLDTHPPTTGQDAECAWNSSFEPDATCMTDPRVYQGADAGLHPVVCVDWCDAYAYCKAKGKRLCGNIAGGSNPVTDDANRLQSQWYGACVSGTEDNLFPYGDFFDPLACNGYGRTGSPDTDTTLPVGTLPRCQSSVPGYQGVYDLSGNVWEWEDSCSIEMDACLIRGGSFVNDFRQLPCAFDFGFSRTAAKRSVGLRCCAS